MVAQSAWRRKRSIRKARDSRLGVKRRSVGPIKRLPFNWISGAKSGMRSSSTGLTCHFSSSSSAIRCLSKAQWMLGASRVLGRRVVLAQLQAQLKSELGANPQVNRPGF